MTDEWIWYWAKCLSLNKAYDSSQSIYTDFGDLTKLPRFNSKEWHEWLEPRRHLFCPTTVGTKVIAEPKYKLSLQRAGDYQMRAVRRRLMAYTVLGSRDGKAVKKKWQGKTQRITTTTFIDLACKQQLWGNDWDEWGIRREKDYKRMTLKLLKEAERLPSRSQSDRTVIRIGSIPRMIYHSILGTNNKNYANRPVLGCRVNSRRPTASTGGINDVCVQAFPPRST